MSEAIALRKTIEGRFHDTIRTQRTPNQRFYSVTRQSNEFVRDWVKDRCEDKTVLDYCCGDGDFAIWLSWLTDDACGIDISKESIRRARKNRKQKCMCPFEPTFIVMDAENTKFCDNEFDYIIASGVLHHLNIENAYRELSRILAPNGQVICHEPLIYNPIFQAYRRATPHLRTAWESDHILSKADIDLAKTYFGKVEILKFFHLSTLAATYFKSALPYLEAIDSILLKIPLLKWLAWQVVFVLSEPRRS